MASKFLDNPRVQYFPEDQKDWAWFIIELAGFLATKDDVADSESGSSLEAVVAQNDASKALNLIAELRDDLPRLTYTTLIGSSYTADQYTVILVDDDTAGFTVTITLPPALTSLGIHYHIKKLGTTADVVVDGNLGETIDDGLIATIKTQYESMHILSDGSNWHVI
jgi:hypothetical protein